MARPPIDRQGHRHRSCCRALASFSGLEGEVCQQKAEKYPFFWASCCRVRVTPTTMTAATATSLLAQQQRVWMDYDEYNLSICMALMPTHSWSWIGA